MEISAALGWIRFFWIWSWTFTIQPAGRRHLLTRCDVMTYLCRWSLTSDTDPWWYDCPSRNSLLCARRKRLLSYTWQELPPLFYALSSGKQPAKKETYRSILNFIFGQKRNIRISIKIYWHYDIMIENLNWNNLHCMKRRDEILTVEYFWHTTTSIVRSIRPNSHDLF